MPTQKSYPPRSKAKGKPKGSTKSSEATIGAAIETSASTTDVDKQSAIFRANLLAHFQAARDKAISDLSNPEG
jgi:hypothetical protein